MSSHYYYYLRGQHWQSRLPGTERARTATVVIWPFLWRLDCNIKRETDVHIQATVLHFKFKSSSHTHTSSKDAKYTMVPYLLYLEITMKLGWKACKHQLVSTLQPFSASLSRSEAFHLSITHLSCTFKCIASALHRTLLNPGKSVPSQLISLSYKESWHLTFGGSGGGISSFGCSFKNKTPSVAPLCPCFWQNRT